MDQEKEEKQGRKLSKEQQNIRRELYKYHKKKREEWKEFKKTPEGIEVLKKQDRARNIAGNRLRKMGMSMEDLDPFKWFRVK